MRIWLFGFSVCLILLSGCAKADPDNKSDFAKVVFVKPDKTQTWSYDLEIAYTKEKRTRGLMYVKKLDVRSGMLFLFKEEKEQSFWMKNTYIPLDIIFIDKTKTIVGIVHNAPPFTLLPQKINKPSIYVVELNANTARTQNIEIGDKLNFVSPLNLADYEVE